MRELFLILIGIAVGSLMSGWSLWTIIGYYRSNAQERYGRRFYFRLAWIVGLIGLADLLKVLRDLFKLLA